MGSEVGAWDGGGCGFDGGGGCGFDGGYGGGGGWLAVVVAVVSMVMVLLVGVEVPRKVKKVEVREMVEVRLAVVAVVGEEAVFGGGICFFWVFR